MHARGSNSKPERDELRTSLSQEIFEEAYADARARAAAETGLPEEKLPQAPPCSLAQALDVDFLPD